MVSNPLRCFPGGTLTVLGDQRLLVQPAGCNLEYEGYYPSRNLTRDSAMLKYFWPLSNDTVKSLGAGVLVIGAITDPQSKTPFANYLANTISKPNHTTGTQPGLKYTVTCEFNPRASFAYHKVVLDMRTSKANGSNYGYYLSGGDPCIPRSPTIGDVLFTIAATALYRPMMENYGSDGYFLTIDKKANRHSKSSYAFPNSKNPLEDILGLMTALVVADLPISRGGVVADAEESYGGRANAVIEAAQLGTQQGETLILLIPPAASLVILVALFALSLQPSWRPPSEQGERGLLPARPHTSPHRTRCLDSYFRQLTYPLAQNQIKVSTSMARSQRASALWQRPPPLCRYRYLSTYLYPPRPLACPVRLDAPYRKIQRRQRMQHPRGMAFKTVYIHVRHFDARHSASIHSILLSVPGQSVGIDKMSLRCVGRNCSW